MTTKQYTTSRPFTGTPKFGSELVPLPDGTTVVLRWKKLPDGVAVDKTAEIVNGKFYYQPTREDMSDPGVFLLQWIATFPGGTEQTFPDEGTLDLVIEALT